MLNFLAAIGSAPGGGGSSFESIATATGTGSSGTITFSSIPSTYQHLQIRFVGTLNIGAGQSANLQFNGDTGTNYSYHWLRGQGVSASATGVANASLILANDDQVGQTSNPNVYIVDIHDYASTTKNKTVRIFSGGDDNGSGYVNLISGLWRNTNAISSLTIKVPSGSWTTSSRFALYGIKGA